MAERKGALLLEIPKIPEELKIERNLSSWLSE